MDATVVAIIAAVAAPLGAYLVAARRFSGKIESSDAKDLWAESRSIRDWSQARVTELNTDIQRLEERIANLESSNIVLIQENRRLIQQVAELKAKLAVSEARVAELEKRNGIQ